MADRTSQTSTGWLNPLDCLFALSNKASSEPGLTYMGAPRAAQLHLTGV